MIPPTKQMVRKMYAYKALVDFILLYPLYNLMFAAHGISTLQISTLLIIWSVTDMLTNVPTGVLADRFSRRRLLILSPLIEALGFVIWWAWPAYGGFATGFILWGIGGAIIDGAYEALLFDELKNAGIEKYYVKVAGRAQSFSLVANFSATLLASLAIMRGYNFAIGASVAALVVASWVASTLPETRHFEKAAEPKYFSLLWRGLSEALRNRILLEFILLGGFIGAIYGSLEEYLPLLFRQAGFATAVVPILVALTVLAAAAASFAAHRFENLKTGTFMFLIFLAGIALVAAGNLQHFGLVLLLVVYTFLIKLVGTIYDGKIQHTITGKFRATITSVSLFAAEILSIAVYFLYGLLSRYGGNYHAFKGIGVVVVVFAVCFAILSPRLLSTQTLRQERVG